MKRHAGFTFLELMLAVTILGLVMAVIFSTWSAGMMGWKKTSSVSDNFQRERIVMGLLADLTKSVVFMPNDDNIYNVLFERDPQTGDRISFVTASNSLLPPTEEIVAGMRRITIGMQQDQRGRPFLAFANTPALVETDTPETELPHVLSTEVCGFAVRLRSAHDGAMKDRLDDPDVPPSAIEYTIAFGANDGRVPPVVVTRTIELPIAQYALQQRGQALHQQNTTNSVSRRDIDLQSGPSEAE